MQCSAGCYGVVYRGTGYCVDSAWQCGAVAVCAECCRVVQGVAAAVSCSYLRRNSGLDNHDPPVRVIGLVKPMIGTEMN